MRLYPAIDLKDGQCVRLLRGEMDKATVFNDDPGAQAKAFEDAGTEWIHVVDLNGAFAGKAVNADAVTSILTAVDAKVQMGGGIRTLENVAFWLEKGLSRVILGTVALRDPELVKQACKAFPGRIAVGIDAKDGFVAVEGWAEVSEITALDLALKFEDSKRFGDYLYRYIARRGHAGPEYRGDRQPGQSAFHPGDPVGRRFLARRLKGGEGGRGQRH